MSEVNSGKKYETVSSSRDERKRKLQDLKAMLNGEKEEKEKKEEESVQQEEVESPKKSKKSKKDKKKIEIMEKKLHRLTGKHYLATIPKINSESSSSENSSSSSDNESETSTSSSSSSSTPTPDKKKTKTYHKLSSRKLQEEFEKLREQVEQQMKKQKFKKYKRKKTKNNGLFPSHTSQPRVYPNGNPQSSMFHSSGETVAPLVPPSRFQFL